MTSDVADPMAAEFGTVAEWTAHVAAGLGPEYHVPAACRGSGQPMALDWLLDRLHPGPDDLMLDVGAGVSGPAAYAAARTGVRPEPIDDPPQGNHFPTSTGLHALLGRADLAAEAAADTQEMSSSPADWLERTAVVERELRRRFGATPQLAAAGGQSDRIGALLSSGQLTSQVLLVRTEAEREGRS